MEIAEQKELIASLTSELNDARSLSAKPDSLSSNH
jgi:hypothetical protein